MQSSSLWRYYCLINNNPQHHARFQNVLEVRSSNPLTLQFGKDYYTKKKKKKIITLIAIITHSYLGMHVCVLWCHKGRSPW